MLSIDDVMFVVYTTGITPLIEKKHYSTNRRQTLHHQWTTDITPLIEKKHYSTHRQQTLHHQWTTYITPRVL
jgi:hypothetical protein